MSNRNNEINFIEILDEIENEHSLIERIGENTIQLYNNEKHDDKRNHDGEKATGQAMLLNHIQNLSVVDIDINKDLNEQERATIRDELIKRVQDKVDVIVQTTSGGIHIYANMDNFEGITSNRMNKCVKTEKYDVDLFACFDESKRSLVVLPESECKNKHDEVCKYQFIKGNFDSVINVSLEEILNCLNINIQKSKNSKIVKQTKTTIDEAADFMPDDDETNDDENEMNDELFDVVINGFEGLEIHKDAAKIEDEITLFTLFQAINSLSDDKKERMYRQVKDKCILTTSAKQNWNKEIVRYEDKRTNPYVLIKILKIHNNDYYKANIEPLMNKSKLNFKNSNYTVENFKHDFITMKTINELIDKLRLCLAINTRGGYIIKTRSEDDYKTIQFQDIKRSELADNIGSLTFTFQTSESDKQRMKEQHKKIKDTDTIKIEHIFTNNLYLRSFDLYDGIDLMTTNENILQLYNPPAGTYDEQLINDWLAFMKTLIHNEEGFNELLDSHAYRFRHPNEYIEKFFINYGTGHNGKSYLAACLASIYPGFANVATTQEQIERDNFTAWIVRNLMIWMEEAETSNYQSKSIQQRVKQLTTKNASARGMYKEVKSSRNWAIFGMNTNQKDLYGLARGDKALIDRLVILNFKDNVYSTEELDQKCRGFISNSNFAYSLYHYLANVREIRKGFSPVRYYGKDKYDFLRGATAENKNSVEDWFVECCDIEGFTHERKLKDGTIEIFIFEKQANDSYNTWKQYHKDRKCMIQYIKETMKKLGFSYATTTIDKIKGVHIYKIEKTKYEEIMNNLSPELEDDGEEWEIEGIDINDYI